MPMDRSAVKALVDAELDGWMRALGIPHWRVAVTYDAEESGTMASIDCLPEYERATINLDPAQQDDDAAVRANLRHELMHAVAADYKAFARMTDAAIGKDSESQGPMGQAYTFHAERLIRCLERMYDGLTHHHPLRPESKPKAKRKAKARRVR